MRDKRELRGWYKAMVWASAVSLIAALIVWPISLLTELQTLVLRPPGSAIVVQQGVLVVLIGDY